MTMHTNNSNPSSPENVIIIGSGPAGLTAAIYTARANIRPLMFEGFSAGGVPGGQLMITTEVENYPGFPEGVTGPELMVSMRKQAVRFGARIVTEDVDEVDFKKTPYTIKVADKMYVTKAVIIATGATARYIGLDSEKRLMNRGVSACATCDGALPMFRNQELVVVGGGDSAMEEATFLTRFASHIHLVHRSEQFRASKIMLERTKKNPKITFVTHTVVDEILGQEQVEGVRLRHVITGDRQEKKVTGVFVAIGHSPNTTLFKEELRLNETGYIITQGKSTYTEVPGVFACGDVQDHVYRQAITAAGSGCQAAIDCERYLEVHP